MNEKRVVSLNDCFHNQAVYTCDINTQESSDDQTHCEQTEVENFL